MSQAKEERSLGELFGDLARETSALVRQEVQLAKTEMTQKATAAGKNAGLLVAAGCLGFVGFQALVATLILALAQRMSPWLAALLVTVALFAVAAILAMKGVAALKAGSLAPSQAVETLKEDAQWAKQQLK